MPRESQYVEAYLNTTADPGTRWTPDTYLAYTLHGKAKDYSRGYANALMRALNRRVRDGTVISVRSKGGSTAYIRAGAQPALPATAEGNREFVRKLLREKEPGLAAALEDVFEGVRT